VNGSEEVFGGFIVASGDASEELEFGEEVLNQVARFIEFLVVLSLYLAISFGRDDSLFACQLQGFEHPLVGVEALVGDHRIGFELGQQHIGAIQIAGLAFGEMEAERIDGGVDIGAQPAFAASDGL